MTFIGGVGTVAGPALGTAFYVLLKEVLVVLALPGGLLEMFRKLARLWNPRPTAWHFGPETLSFHASALWSSSPSIVIARNTLS